VVSQLALAIVRHAPPAIGVDLPDCWLMSTSTSLAFVIVPADLPLPESAVVTAIVPLVAKNTLLAEPPVTSPSPSRQWSHVE